MNPLNPFDRQAKIEPFLTKAKKLLAKSRHRELAELCTQILGKDGALAETYGFRRGDEMAEVYGFRGFARQELGDLEGRSTISRPRLFETLRTSRAIASAGCSWFASSPPERTLLAVRPTFRCKQTKTSLCI